MYLNLQSIVLFLLLITFYTFSQTTIVISNIEGSLLHDSLLVISGSSFGTKSPAAPIVWDNCSGSSITTLWDGGVPNVGTTAYRIQYRDAPYRDVDAPHDKVNRFMVGAHGDDNGWNEGYNVMVWKVVSNISKPSYLYASYYVRVDPHWYPGSDNNFKFWDHTYGNDGPYGNQYFYIEYNGHFTSSQGSPGNWHVNNLIGSNEWGDAGTHPMYNWAKHEIEYRIDSTSSGYIKGWDNGTLVMNFSGTTDNKSGTTRTFSFGGYARQSGQSNNFRYFADLYLDTSRARVIIGNHQQYSKTTIREIQIPVIWSDTEITIKINRGKFPSDDNNNMFLYIINKDGQYNNNGFPLFEVNNLPSIPKGIQIRK